MTVLGVFLAPPNGANQGVFRFVGTVLRDSLLVESVIGQTVDAADFTVHDPRRQVLPETYSEVQVWAFRDARSLQQFRGAEINGYQNSGQAPFGATKEFAGLAVMIDGHTDGIERYWELGCQDYTVLMDRSLILQQYRPDYTYRNLRGQDLVGDVAILASIFERDTLGPLGISAKSPIEVVFDREYVQQGLPSLSQQEFRYNSQREALSQLAQYVGYDFYVDYDRRLHYYYRKSQRALYRLTDRGTGPLDVGYYKLNWKRDGSRIVNTFALFGDRLITENQTSLVASDGEQLVYNLNQDTVGVHYPLLPEVGRDAIRVDYNRNRAKGAVLYKHVGEPSRLTLTIDTENFTTGTRLTEANPTVSLEDQPIEVGDVVINYTDKSWGVVRAPITATSLQVDLRGGRSNEWRPGDYAYVPTWSPQPVVTAGPLTLAEDIEEAGELQHDAIGRSLTMPPALKPPYGEWAMRLRYVHNFVGGQVDSDPLSIERYGQVLARRVVASDVNSAQGMLQKLEHLKDQYADALEIATLSVDDQMLPRGIRPVKGEWVAFENSVLGVYSREYQVHRVTTRLLGGDLLEYALELRSWEVDLL